MAKKKVRATPSRRSGKVSKVPVSTDTASDNEASSRASRLDSSITTMPKHVGVARSSGGLVPYAITARLNASLELLHLDFLSHRLTQQQTWFIEATNEIYDNSCCQSSHERSISIEMCRGWRHIKLSRTSFRARIHQLRYGVLRPLTAMHAPNCHGKRAFRLPWLRRRHAHFFLDGCLNSRVNPVEINKRAYWGLYRTVEDRLMRYFNVVLPEPELMAQDGYAEEETMAAWSAYISASERMLHTLSQKPHFYTHLLLFSLTSQLRNLRRFVYQNPPSIMMIELTVIITEALKLTQEHLHKLCRYTYGKHMNKLKINTSALSAMDTAVLLDSVNSDLDNSPMGLDSYNAATVSPGKHERQFVANIQCLNKLYDDCIGLKLAIDTIVERASKAYCNEVDCELTEPVEGNPLLQLLFGASQENTTSAGNAPSETESVCATPTSENPDVEFKSVMSHALTEFGTKIKAELFQWSIAMCKYTLEANKVLMGPVLDTYKAIGVVPTTSGCVRLYKQICDSNISLHRIPCLVDILRKMVKKPGSSVSEPSSAKLSRDTLGKQTPRYDDYQTADHGSPLEPLNPSGNIPFISHDTNDPEVTVDIYLTPPVGLRRSPRVRNQPASMSLQKPRLQKGISSTKRQHPRSLSPTKDKEPAFDVSARQSHQFMWFQDSEVDLSLEDLGTNESDISASISSSNASTTVSARLDTEGLADVAMEAGDDMKPQDYVEVPPASGHFDAQKTPKTPKATVRSPKIGLRRRQWQRDEVQTLIDAVNRHGTGRWTFFADTYFGGRRTGSQLKDKWANLTRYKYVYQDTASSKDDGRSSYPLWKLIDSF
ncbi:homeodomain-like superfamily protein, putative [Babesia ovis]|uniref:Homeodomain-like superfamily protein, putative n=1 Tax=Babesia ovis TaxID=5869 RepID=A0A9W5T8K6_BABOV|nr:homeodomain-like superfamily protein, putative [Babesia ovis]